MRLFLLLCPESCVGLRFGVADAEALLPWHCLGYWNLAGGSYASLPILCSQCGLATWARSPTEIYFLETLRLNLCFLVLCRVVSLRAPDVLGPPGT